MSQVLEEQDLLAECRGVQISQILLTLLSNAHDAVLAQPARWVRIYAAPVAFFAAPRIVRIAATSNTDIPTSTSSIIAEACPYWLKRNAVLYP